MGGAAVLCTNAGTDPTGPSVPFFSQAATFESVWPVVRRQLHRIIDRGAYSGGAAVAEFERALAAWTGARHAVAVNSGTDALLLLLRACGLRPGDEVVVPAFGPVAGAAAVVLAGGRPVFADIDPVGYGVDPRAVAAAVTPRTRFLLPAHLGCQLADLAGVTRVASRYGLTVIEDGAAAVGMRWAGRHAGLHGAGGALSFAPAGTLGAIGDAGAVLTDNAELAEAVAALRHHGRFGRPVDGISGSADPAVLPGLNSRMDDIQAAVLLAKLGRLDADIARRAELAAAYTERLTGMPGVHRLPTLVARPAPTDPVFARYLVEVARREELAAFLAARGVGTEVRHPLPLYRQPCFAAPARPAAFPNAEAAAARVIALPLYPDLPLAAVDRVCAAIADFHRAGGTG